MKRPMKKLDDKRLGPFLILEKIGKSAFKLDIPQSWKHHPVFNEALLTRFIPASFKGQDIPRPPPKLDEEGIAVYEVELIIDKWKKGRGTQYLVKWKGYPHSENTWEPASSLTKAQDAIRDFGTKSA
jgi:Chromo (CHRromatin Organisation MOdifier) domain